MGYGPREVDKWSLAEYFAVVEGWNKVNGAPEKPTAQTESEFERNLAIIEEREANGR